MKIQDNYCQNYENMPKFVRVMYRYSRVKLGGSRGISAPPPPPQIWDPHVCFQIPHLLTSDPLSSGGSTLGPGGTGPPNLAQAPQIFGQ